MTQISAIAPARASTPADFAGSAPRRLVESGFQVNVLRVYKGNDGRAYMTVMENGKAVARPITANALLRRDEWRDMDRTLIRVAQEQLNIVADLRAAGLVRNLGGLGTLMAEYERISDMGPANIDMSGTTRGDEDTLDFGLDGVPVPIIHKSFRLNLRRLLASRRNGQGLDATQGEAAGRKVAEKINDLYFNGSTITLEGRRIYGLLNHPQLLGVQITDWTDASTRDPVGDLLKLVGALVAAGFKGPYGCYLPSNFWAYVLEDYKVQSDRTVLERIQAIPNLRFLKPDFSIPASTISMFQLTSDVIQSGEAQDITNVEWDEIGGMEQHYKVLAAMVPLIKVNTNNKTGIAKGVAV